MTLYINTFVYKDNVCFFLLISEEYNFAKNRILVWNLSWPVSEGRHTAGCCLRIPVHTALPTETLRHSSGELSAFPSTCNRTADLPGESPTPQGEGHGAVGGGLTLLIPFHPGCGHVPWAQLRPLILIASSLSQEFCSAVALTLRRSGKVRTAVTMTHSVWSSHWADWRPLGFSRLNSCDLHAAHSWNTGSERKPKIATKGCLVFREKKEKKLLLLGRSLGFWFHVHCEI